ncbi:FxsA family protein [Streptosporangium sp. NPDC000396]|uniref:FxsA family protein n=1 Tax=Streptosporangium sp. NPDC000396 TaxID=3366185 RepID=UPI0036A861BD
MRFLLFLLFLVVPLLEIWVLIQVGQVIGGWPTVALLLADSLLGAWVVRREGRKAWRNLQGALQSGRMPERELTDGVMVVAGGTLLLTPGFVTDLVGFLCLLPLTRPLVRRLGAWFFARRVRTLTQTVAGPGFGSPFDGMDSPFDVMRGQGGGSGPVIHGEVIREEPGTPGARDSGRDLTGR